ncbi:hypothetical protein [Rhizobium leguminosarum]|uniref:hypothetical protein n=1 Tax=Rhizobium leguminosarum TaxID=384 RepID=UPI0003FE987B|nr:hypothetical protein [Rhizobium leguminosarum]
MEFHLLNRLAEINLRVGPVLDELGIKPRIVHRSDGAVLVQFKTSDQQTVSPVEIRLAEDAKTTTSPASWKGSKMSATFWEDIEIGDTGWTLQEFCRSHHKFDIGSDPEPFFTALAEWLPGHGVIHLDRSKDGFTMNEDFARAFKIIRTALPDDEQIDVKCERGPASDAYVFNYPPGCDWRFEFVGRSVAVTANGEEVTLVDTTELKKLIPAIRTRLKELSARRNLGI